MHDHMPRRPRVLVLTSTFPRWADDPEPAFVFELSRRLCESYEITVLAPRSAGSRRRETMAGLNVVRFPYFFNRWETLANQGGGILNRLKTNRLNYLLLPFFLMGQFAALAGLLRKNEYDLIHAHWIIPQGLLAVFLRGILRCKAAIVCTSHGGDLFALQGKLLQCLKARVISSADALTLVSHAMQTAKPLLKADAGKFHVIPMGVDLRHAFTPDTHVRRGEHELLFVGRIVEKKGLHILLKAMPEVLNAFPDCHLTVAGAGPLEQEVKRQAHKAGLSRKITFLGMLAQAELPALYRRAALAVFPFVVAKSGDQEGLGLVVVEAMGCGCPVIASDLATVRDTVEHGVTGMLVPPGSPDALAAAIIESLKNPDKREEMASNARNNVVGKFDWQTIAGKYSELYARYAQG